MPTKTNEINKTSPAKAIPPSLIMPMVKGTVGTLAGMATGVGSEVSQLKDEFKEKGYKDLKFGKKLKMLAGAGARVVGANLQGALGGLATGLTGSDMGVNSIKGSVLGDNNPEAPEPTENIAQNSSVQPNPVFDPNGQNMIQNVTSPENTYGSLFT